MEKCPGKEKLPWLQGALQHQGLILNHLGMILVDPYLVCQKKGTSLDVLLGGVSKEAWGVCGASLDVSSAVTVKSC